MTIQTLSEIPITRTWFVFLINFIDSTSDDSIREHGQYLRVEKVRYWLMEIQEISDYKYKIDYVNYLRKQKVTLKDDSILNDINDDTIESITLDVLCAVYREKFYTEVVKRRKMICLSFLEKKELKNG